jgi:hypothetical protein
LIAAISRVFGFTPAGYYRSSIRIEAENHPQGGERQFLPMNENSHLPPPLAAIDSFSARGNFSRHVAHPQRRMLSTASDVVW